MIINTSQGNIEVVGDVKEFKTSIDPKNLEFITTLLSSNLYSNPEQSFIREIVSNAWDSHVEAGNTDTPVIIKFTEEDAYHDSITIRDFGTGLSPERFNEIYRNIGSSTKRDSNDYIGCFGIGHLSPFACSNTVYITSYYNGTAYYYLGSKSNNTITYHRLMEKPTTEKNGVEVTIKGIRNTVPYDTALDYIVFFPNIYIDGTNKADRINSVKLKRFKNFAAASMTIYSRLLLGNVLYPLDTSMLSPESQGFCTNLYNSGIVIKFDIGEINVTPNRESVIYSPETIKKINERIAEAKKELFSIIAEKLTINCTDIWEYTDIMTKPLWYNPISDKILGSNYDLSCYRIEPKLIPNTKITYLGYDLSSYTSFLLKIKSLNLPNYRGTVYNDRIYKNVTSYRVDKHRELSSPKILILNSGARLVEAAKLYIKNNYDEFAIMTDIDYYSFRSWIQNETDNSIPCGRIGEIIIQGAYDYLTSKAKTLNLNTNKDYLDFKSSMTTVKNNVPLKDAILYIWNERGYKEKKYFKTLQGVLKHMKAFRKGIILANMADNAGMLQEVANLKGYVFIQARKDVVADIRKLNPSYLVDMDWLLNKDPLIAAVKATLIHFPAMIDTMKVRNICYNLPASEGNELKKIVRLRNIFGDSYYYRGIVNRTSIKPDSYTEYMCVKLENYLTQWNKVESLIRESGVSWDTILSTALIVKTKAYRVSNSAYQKVRNNKLLRILCKK